MKTLYFTVTNDLTYDQRMHRICSTLATNGYRVVLVGRRLKHSKPLQVQAFQQHRLKCWWNRGFLFYAEYNLRLFLFLVFKKADGICAIDLDTILPCLAVTKLKNSTRIYDAHEFFTGLKEVHIRPHVKKFWTAIERLAVPRFRFGYTVSEGIAVKFKELYNRNYIVIRNMPPLQGIAPSSTETEPYLFYGGAVNEARGFEVLIPAMQTIQSRLVIAGDGNFMPQLKSLIAKYGVEKKLTLTGMVAPPELRKLAAGATLGMALAEGDGLNQYLALPNKFFDYLHAGLPQIAMNYPEYQKINANYKVAVLLDELTVTYVSNTINDTLKNKTLLSEMKAACLQAKEIYNWNNEEKNLLHYYKTIFEP